MRFSFTQRHQDTKEFSPNFTRQVDEIARIEVLGADGRVETIEGTTVHPIWSLDRHDWIPLGELAEGEQLLGSVGPALILTHAILHRSLPVYNIEVHGEQVYEVGELGLLVHNACPVPVSGLRRGGGLLDLSRTLPDACHDQLLPFNPAYASTLPLNQFSRYSSSRAREGS